MAFMEDNPSLPTMNLFQDIRNYPRYNLMEK